MKNCLLTVSDADFSIATEVLLYSFHKYNPGFDGDVVVISDALPDSDRGRIRRVSPARFEAPDPRLARAVEQLQSTEPRLEGIYRRLFSLEAFRFERYDRVVCLDSDIYCCRDISELFTRTEPLLACPDGFTYGDWIAARISGDVARKSERYGRAFAQSFNAGVLSIAPPALGEQTYEDLLGLLEPGRWREISSGKFTDQMLLNLLFDGRFEPLEACFNFMVFLEGYQQIWEGASFLDARLVHFAGAIKPWLEYEDGVLARRAPRFIKFFEAWRALLDEARAGHRSRDDREDTAKQFSAHKAWIADYNENPIEPVGRIY